MAIGHYTHQKNPIFATAGLTTLSILENENLVARCEEMGHWWKKELNEAVIGSKILMPPVGEGLLLRLEIVETAHLANIYELCFEQGCLGW
ncbi:hypothetical protein C9J38_08980 [Photobacterium sp. GB-210]|nr:hypothetical protein C9J38_08980 [Photobacterium sp. GB-210]